jgi:NAD-dependent SIR2 family protein deacetylase
VPCAVCVLCVSCVVCRVSCVLSCSFAHVNCPSCSHLLEAQKLPSLAEVAQLYCRACGESLLHPSTEGHNAELQPSSGHEHALIKKAPIPHTRHTRLK